MLKTNFAQEDKAPAEQQWDEVADTLRSMHAKIGALMDPAREDVLAYRISRRSGELEPVDLSPLSSSSSALR
jgi:hypothetical protein